jgi:hypothetical protein
MIKWKVGDEIDLYLNEPREFNGIPGLMVTRCDVTVLAVDLANNLITSIVTDINPITDEPVMECSYLTVFKVKGKDLTTLYSAKMELISEAGGDESERWKQG